VRRLAPLLAAALLAGCSSREHANPFDPANPVTNGRPPGFAALAGPQLVQLRWTRPSLAGDFSYRLFRRGPADADFIQVGSDLSGSVSSYLDFGRDNGATYQYRLFYVFSGAMGGLPAEDYATPGPLRPWCADLSRRTLISLTPDAHHIVSETGGFFGPTQVAVDPLTDAVWVTDTYEGAVVILNPATGARTPLRGPGEPVSVALDPIDGSGWVGVQGIDAVNHFTRNGVAGNPAQIPAVGNPIGIATDPTTGTVWVCARSSNEVRRYTRAGALIGLPTTVGAPSRVAVDSLTGDAWVTSFEGAQVVRISSDGTIVTTVPLSGPIGVAVDNRRGRIWVADARAGQVVAVRSGGAIEFRVGGLVETREIAVDLATGDAWVTCPGIRAVARLSASGAIRERLGGFDDPYGIALDPGQGRSF
jgi:DNA-binding beta-propeller fold protein YncE